MIFGQVFKGFDVLEAIANVATDSLDMPLVPVTLEVKVLKMTPEECKINGYEVSKSQ
jgi:peptidyl-prolyl cis-trans isomerase B (cyclophilin B)